jgi:putative membrane protein
VSTRDVPAAEPVAKPRDLGAVRTMMAADRTLMAWIRTALSMLSFGFTIYKVLQGFQESGRAISENTPRNAGIFLVVAGTVAILMGTIEYGLTLQQLRMLEPFRLLRPTLIMAVLMCASGLFLCFGILTRQL